MTWFVYLIAYLSVIVFTAAVLGRFISYLRNPIHVRWELYPVAHEGKRAEWGGSYLEEVDWWKKEREFSLVGELKVMVPEILLLKAVWEHNRPLWFVTYPFHLGLYILCAFLGVLIVGVMLQLAGISLGSGIAPGSVVMALMSLLGPLGLILTFSGAFGLFVKRLTDPDMRTYSSFGHFFNLTLFMISTTVALLTWLFVDPSFSMLSGFFTGLITFDFIELTHPLFIAQLVIAFLLVAYIPNTHMAHFFMKYFLYHDIRWGDKPNVGTPETDAKINTVLNYPVSWSAEHIAIEGKKTWAEVAMYNPMRPEGEQE